MSRRRAFLLAVSCLAALQPSAASALEGHIAPEKAVNYAGQPFRVVIHGVIERSDLFPVTPPPAPTGKQAEAGVAEDFLWMDYETSWQRKDGAIEVLLEVNSVDFGFPFAPKPFLFSVPIDSLPAGDHPLRLLFQRTGRPGIQELATGEMRVLPASGEAWPPAPWRVGPEGRFELEVVRRDGQGVLASARPVFPPDAPGGQGWESSLLFYFFSAGNWELMVKILDGCAINGYYWVFAAASTEVEYAITVGDRDASTTRTWRHEAGTPARALAETSAFACAP